MPHRMDIAVQVSYYRLLFLRYLGNIADGQIASLRLDRVKIGSSTIKGAIYR